MDYLDINRKFWNDSVNAHLASEFYGVEAFLKGRSSLTPIETALMGDVAGKSLLHLQCHFGQDTLSLSRLGAVCTGVDFSPKAIEAANELAAKTSQQVEFICSDIYALPEKLNREFDLVFTSFGTIGWLPELDRWAAVVSRYLKSGGRFVIADFHPVVWMFDNDFKEVRYRYFNDEPIVETEEGTYADRTIAECRTSMTWNHGFAEILTALLNQGLQITQVREFDYSPFNCFNNTVEDEPGKFRIAQFGNKLPMVYAIEAMKTFQ